MANNNNKVIKDNVSLKSLNNKRAEELIYKLEIVRGRDGKHYMDFVNNQHFQFFLRTAEFCKFVKIANFLDGVENARKAVSRS